VGDQANGRDLAVGWVACGDVLGRVA
jgi:hypothetical protein